MSAVMPARPWSRDHGIGARWALLSFLVLVLAILGTPVRAAEDDPVGRATITLGTVEAVDADGAVRRLGRRDPVFEGDTLRTGPRGRAQIRFTDRGLLSLRPDTELAIEDYEFDSASPTTSRQELSVTRGGFRVATGRIADANRDAWRVRSPLAVIGVRGTIFDLFQQPDGPLTLGMARGGIRMVTLSGNEAFLGEGAGFDYVRVRTDGSVAYLIEPPAELDASPGLDEGDDGSEDGEGSEDGDGGDGGDGDDGAEGNEGADGDEGADLGGTEDSTVATGGGDAGSSVGAVSDSGGGVLAFTVDPESTGVVSESSTGSGDLPTEQPVPLDGLLATADREALIGSGQFAVVAGVSSTAVDATGVPVIEGYGVGSGLGALDADANPLLAGSLDSTSDFPPGVETTDRATLLSAADVFLTSSSGSVTGLSQPAGGAAGVTWGRFAQPARLFLDASDPTRFIETSGPAEIPFLVGTPTDIADLSGQRFYELLEADVVTGPDYLFLEMFSDALLDLGTGELEGILDVALAESATPETMRFIYVVDYNARVRGGLIQDTTVSLATLFDQNTGEERTVDAELSGFLSGTDAEYLNVGFAYSVPDDPGLDTAGLVLLQSGLTPANALTADERLAIDQGFAFVAAECCFEGDTAEGLVSDPRPTGGLDALAALNRDTNLVPVSPLDPAFVDFPPNTVVRRQDAGVVDFATFDLGAGGELASFEWQGFDGGPVGLFDSTTGDPTGEVTGNLLVLTGRMADLADLGGTGRFELADLSRGFFASQSGTLAAQPLQGGDISFNVDFADGRVFGGLARLLTDADDATAPSQERDRFDVVFEGQVALANSSPFVEFVINDGRYFDSDGDASGEGLLDLAESDLSGFFAGDGSVFNMSLNLQSAPLDAQTPHDPINAVALAILQQQDLSLSAAELTQLEQGRVFVAAGCCGIDGGVAAGPSGDPANIGGDVFATNGDFILGLNVGPNGEDLTPLDPGFLDPSPEQIARKAGAFGFVDPDFPVPAEIDLVAGSWDGFPGNRAIIVDPASGAILEELDDRILFMSGFPTDVATLQSSGFTTFAGATDVFAQGIRTLGMVSQNNLSELDPNLPGAIVGGALSFNVDLANGDVSNGHFFSLMDAPDERGMELFFDGQVAYAQSNTFVEVNLVDGVFNQNTPIDLVASEMELFFAGDGPGGGSAHIALGSFYLVSDTTSAFPNTGQAVSAGVFSVGNSLLPEVRLSAQDALALENPDPGRIRLGMAAFARNSYDSPSAPLPIGAEGLLLGRAADASQPGFFLGANPLYVVDDGSGTPVATTTSRRGFFMQPFDFILRKDQAGNAQGLFNANVIPAGGTDFSGQGFAVSWDAWNGGSSLGAKLHDDPANAANGVIIDRDVFFASVTPTPQSQMPVTGVFSYGGSLAALDAQVLATGAGEISFAPQPTFLSEFSVGFDVDFASGAISGGQLIAGYEGQSATQMQWTVGFDGFVNGAVADLAVSSIDVLQDGSPVAGAGFQYPFDASMSGIFTGPSGERFAGGFSIDASEPLDGLTESIQGLYVIDRQGGPL